MNTNKLVLALSSFAIVFASSATFVACSSDDNSNPGPTPLDASTDTSVGSDTGPGTDGSTQSDSSTDGGTPDTGTCTSDAATCNSCVTQAQDPLHACSPATANCVPFDNTRVPANVPSP
jgi:hypothetical protein